MGDLLVHAVDLKGIPHLCGKTSFTLLLSKENWVSYHFYFLTLPWMHLLHINTLPTHESLRRALDDKSHVGCVFVCLFLTLMWMCHTPRVFMVARMTDGFHLNGTKTKKEQLHFGVNLIRRRLWLQLFMDLERSPFNEKWPQFFSFSFMS